MLSSLFHKRLAFLFIVKICSKVRARTLYIKGMRFVRKNNLSLALQGDLRETGSRCSHRAVPKPYNCHTEEHVLTRAFPYVLQSKGHGSLKWGQLMPSEGQSYVKNWKIHLSTWRGFHSKHLKPLVVRTHNLGQLAHVGCDCRYGQSEFVFCSLYLKGSILGVICVSHAARVTG